MIQITIPFLQIKPNIDFLVSKRLVYHIDWWRFSFYLHVFSSPFVIFSGLFQFNRYILNNHKKLHRFLGVIYLVVLIFIAAPSGFLIGLYANGSYPTQISFSLLSIFWLLTTIIAYLKLRDKNYIQHSRWMLRSYALTLSALTLRFLTYLIAYFKLPIYPTDAYILVSYSSWILNLLVAEWLIYNKFPEKLLNKQ